MLKAVFKGWLAVHVLSLIVAVAMCLFWWTLLLVFFSGAIFLESGVSSAIPWLVFLLMVVFFGAGGYIAASYTRPRRVAAGFLLSAVMVAYSVPLVWLAIASCEVPEESLSGCIGILCMIVFPPIGAFVAKRWRRSDEPVKILRRIPVLLAYAMFSMGVALLLVAGLLWCCWISYTNIDTYSDAAAEVVEPSLYAAGIGLVLVAYAIVVFVKRRGWKKGIALNVYVYVVAITACAFCFGFLARDRENRYLADLTDPDVDFVFPDPANPATLYIQANRLIPKDDSDEQDDLYPIPFSQADKLKLTVFLTDKFEALALALRAEGDTAVRFPQYGIPKLRWQCFDLLRLCETLAAKARLTAIEGDIPETLRYLRHICRISEGFSASDGDNMIMGCHFRSIAVHVLRDMLRYQDLSDRQLSLIAKNLRLWEADVLPDRERWANSTRSKPSQDIEELFRSMRRKSPWSYLTTQAISKNAILSRRSAVIDECLSKPSWRDMYESFSREGDDRIRYMQPFFAPTLGKTACMIEYLARYDISGAAYSARRYLSQLARVRLLRVNAAVLLYRRSKGKLSNGWSDLVGAYLPAPLADPFSGKALLLKPGSDGLCIYSVGDDGEDDGGTDLFSEDEARGDTQQDDEQNTRDIGVIVPGIAGKATSPVNSAP
ncbi:MAG: hypothetical protein GY794_14025 [bacterium]|nr:hypothetical protein [bacterium]